MPRWKHQKRPRQAKQTSADVADLPANSLDIVRTVSFAHFECVVQLGITNAIVGDMGYRIFATNEWESMEMLEFPMKLVNGESSCSTRLYRKHLARSRWLLVIRWSRFRAQPVNHSSLPHDVEQHERPLPLARLGGENQRGVSVAR
jgi:hypothetical protein